MTNIYRNNLPSGNYDLLIVSLIHQPAEMVYYMAKNIEKYVQGKFIWIVHYNNNEPINENLLPDWAWIVRNTINTSKTINITLLLGIYKTLEFAIKNSVTFTNVLTLSSGSAFLEILLFLQLNVYV